LAAGDATQAHETQKPYDNDFMSKPDENSKLGKKAVKIYT
jgi:hypothetical protein